MQKEKLKFFHKNIIQEDFDLPSFAEAKSGKIYSKKYYEFRDFSFSLSLSRICMTTTPLCRKFLSIPFTLAFHSETWHTLCVLLFPFKATMRRLSGEAGTHNASRSRSLSLSRNTTTRVWLILCAINTYGIPLNTRSPRRAIKSRLRESRFGERLALRIAPGTWRALAGCRAAARTDRYRKILRKN